MIDWFETNKEERLCFVEFFVSSLCWFCCQWIEFGVLAGTYACHVRQNWCTTVTRLNWWLHNEHNLRERERGILIWGCSGTICWRKAPTYIAIWLCLHFVLCCLLPCCCWSDCEIQKLSQACQFYQLLILLGHSCSLFFAWKCK